MPTSYNVAQSKRLGAAILKFLEYHGQNARLAPDQEEGVSVAIQCLSLVFDAKPEDAKDIPELMEVYNKEAGDRGIPEEKVINEEDKKKGEAAKTEGNTHMKSKDYQKAVDEYTKAIEFNPKSEVYFCNRAAAYTNLDKFHEALDDCKKAIAINPDYAKAFSRMAENVMSNPNMKGMVDNFMSSMGIQQDPNAPAAANPMEQMANAMGQNGASMGDLMALGQQFAAHMQKENPDMIEQLRGQMAGQMNVGDAAPAKPE